MTNKFPYENLNDEEFQDLVIRISKELFGVGCKIFSIGKDGAKDSLFEGTANCFPSAASPWTGKTIFQAKHTTIFNASCSDKNFSVNQSSLLSMELKRLNEIKSNTPFDNYLLFTNRKLPGEAHTTIINKMRQELQIHHVEIIGREELDVFLSDYPHIANQFGLDRFLEPLRFFEPDIREVITIFAEQRSDISKSVSNYITSYNAIDKEHKNQLNNLSRDYFDFIKSRSLQYFEEIEKFLQNPKNDTYTKMYANTVSDLQAAILLERNRFNEFEYVIEHIFRRIVNYNDDKLKNIREIVRVFVHFMYFNCDIGKTV